MRNAFIPTAAIDVVVRVQHRRADLGAILFCAWDASVPRRIAPSEQRGDSEAQRHLLSALRLIRSIANADIEQSPEDRLQELTERFGPLR